MNIAPHKTSPSPSSHSTSAFPGEVALDTSILMPAKSIPRGKLANRHSDLINLSVINFPAWIRPPRLDNLCENWSNQFLDSQRGQLRPDLRATTGSMGTPELLPREMESIPPQRHGDSSNRGWFLKSHFDIPNCDSPPDWDWLPSRKGDSTTFNNRSRAEPSSTWTTSSEL